MRFRNGMIHGRFQPFHLEHLRYFRVAWERSEHVIIGITNPDPRSIFPDEKSEHRHRPEDNPFTFYERQKMIRDTLRDEGCPGERISIVPFPIHNPELWQYYVPSGTTMFVVAYSPWEYRKVEILREHGYDVFVEDSFEKGISGQQIRSLLEDNGDWESLVPPAVARFLENRSGTG